VLCSCQAPDMGAAFPAANPSMSLMEMSKELGTMWKALSEADKQPYKACHPV
jgi:hypothetical protein